MPRRTNQLKPNKTFLIVVEGQTEQIYFSEMKSLERIPGVTITPKLAKHSSVKTILETAIRECETGTFDSVWCVFDRDTILKDGISKDLQDLFDDAKELKINFADSFPAFEIWFLLHYEMPKRFYENQDEVIKDLQKHLADYSKEKRWLLRENLYSKLKPQLQTAISNAEKLEDADGEQASEACTRCNVHKLFKEVEKTSLQTAYI